MILAKNNLNYKCRACVWIYIYITKQKCLFIARECSRSKPRLYNKILFTASWGGTWSNCNQQQDGMWCKHWFLTIHSGHEHTPLNCRPAAQPSLWGDILGCSHQDAGTNHNVKWHNACYFTPESQFRWWDATSCQAFWHVIGDTMMLPSSPP